MCTTVWVAHMHAAHCGKTPVVWHARPSITWFLRRCITPRPGAVAADGAAAAAAFNKTHEAAAGISKNKTTHKRILRSLQVKNHSLALLYGSSFTVELNDDEAAAGKQARPAFELRRRF